MSLKVTLADIARELKTTAATVSRLLCGDSSISEKMKKKVIDATGRLHYRPHRIAAYFCKGQSSIIDVIIPNAEIIFFGSVVHATENLANKNGYTVLI